MGRCIGIVGLALFLCVACASTNPEMEQRLDNWEVEMSEEIETLKRAVEASYDRERALAERLHQTEEGNAVLRQEMQLLRDEMSAARLQVADDDGQEKQMRSAAFSVIDDYQAALEDYSGRRYNEALDTFTEIVQTVPDNKLADNAQYWMGECYYGMAKYQQALTEFTKVFAYRKTEKDDDAQLKIARCYQALGEREKALAAFQKLVDDFPKSEYVAAAQREMKYLSGL